MTASRIFKKTLKILLIALVSILGLAVLLIIFLHLPVGKNMVRNQSQKFLRSKLQTDVRIGNVDYALPNWVELKGVYFEDQSGDTLLYGGELKVDLKMLKLLRGNTDIERAFLKDIVININRNITDSVFNFNFVIDAFTGNKSTTTHPDTAALKLSLDKLIFSNVAVRFNDARGGTNFNTQIDTLHSTLSRFQPDRLQFFLDDFMASGVKYYMAMDEPAVRDTLSSKDESGVPLLITAQNFDLRQLDVNIDDNASGMYFSSVIPRLGLNEALFDLQQTTGNAESLLLDSSVVVFKAPVTTGVPSAGTNTWRFAANKGELNNNRVVFDDPNVAPTGGFDLAHFDMDLQVVEVDSFRFSNDLIKANLHRAALREKNGFILDSAQLRFLFSDTALLARDVNIKTSGSAITGDFEMHYDSIAAISSQPQNTAVYAQFVRSVISFDELFMLAPALKNSFDPASFRGQRVHFNTEMSGSMERVHIPHLQLQALSGSTLEARGNLYNLNDAERFIYDLEIIRSRFLKQDLLRFVPPENRSNLNDLPPVISLSGRLRGGTNDLAGTVRMQGTGVDFAGRVQLRNITDPQNLGYDVSMQRGTFSRKFIMGFIPPGTLPEGFSIPDNITAEGMIAGSLDDLRSDARFQTSYGNAAIKGFLKNFSDPARATYDLDVRLADFDLGRLLGQDSMLGPTTGHFVAKGSGMEVSAMTGDIGLNITTLPFNGYAYQNVQANLKINKGDFSAGGRIDDEALKTNFDFTGNLAGEYPVVQGMMRVDTALMHVLNFYPDTLSLAFTANVDAPSMQPRNLDAYLKLDSISFVLNRESFPIDSIVVNATSENGIDSISLSSDVARAYATGAFDYDKVIPAVMQYVDRYFDIVPDTAASYPEQDVRFFAAVETHPVLTAMVPGLQQYRDISIEGSFRSADADSALNVVASAGSVQYAGDQLRNGVFNISSSDGKINYHFSADTLTYIGKVFRGSTVQGSAASDTLTIGVVTQDEANRDWFGLKASLGKTGETYTFRLQDSVLLNYEHWTAGEGNFVQFSPEGILVNEFELNSDTSRIRVASVDPIPNSAIDVAIDNFNLRSIASFFSTDTLFMEGIMDSRLTIDDLNNPVPTFTGYAYVSGFNMMQQPMGDLEFYAANLSADLVSARIYLTGNDNDISTSADYHLNTGDIAANISITKMNAATLKGFSAGQLKYASGNIRGNVVLDGNIENPRWNGNLVFDTTRFALTDYGAPYNVTNQQISLSYPNIQFRNFTVLDSLNNKMTISGDITSRSLTRYDLNLDVDADDFIVMNVQRAVGNELFGFASVDADIHIGGTSERPDIEGNVLLNDESDVTIVLPDRNFDRDASRSIVRFMDMDTSATLVPEEGFREQRDAGAEFAKFLNYNLNLEVTKESVLRIIVDPTTGDEMVVRGDAQLNAGVDPGGNIILSGNYLLESGSYVLNYQFLQRRFNLIKGSTITFTGSPMNARVDVTAEYIANSSSRDLLANEVSSVDPILANSFNQKIPFRVVMKLTGVLSQPDIDFDIQLPDEESNVRINSELRGTIENKLSQIRGDESATNKQVFSLLLFNRFIGEQSSDFFKGTGGGFDDLARQSVSQFISSALNEIANDLIKGVDIDLNLNSYEEYTGVGSSQRTDLNLSLSKSFLDDRLEVTVGRNFGIEGQDPVTKAARSNSYMPDLTVAYKLSRDGRYMIRAYRRNQFEVILDGYVVETGVGFVVTMDYDRFRELFRKRK